MNCSLAIVTAEWVYLFAVAVFLCSILTLVNEIQFTITMINSSFVVASFIYFAIFRSLLFLSTAAAVAF